MRKKIWCALGYQDPDEIHGALHLQVAQIEPSWQRLVAHLQKTYLILYDGIELI